MASRTCIVVCVVVLAATFAELGAGQSTGVTYNPSAAVAWLLAQGCSNSSQNPTCPGGIPCYDDEFTARMLAAGGAVNLNPNDLSNAAYKNYPYNGNTYDLTTQSGPPNGLYDYLNALGWYNPQLPGCDPNNETACFPAGAVIMTQNIWQQPVPLSAIGGGMCSCGSPLNTDAPHCNMPCSFFDGTDLFYPPPPIVRGPLLGSYTPNNQTFQDFSLWPNMFNTPENSIDQALTVVEVGWSADDATKVENILNFIWNFDPAIPIITWMPYPYKSWANPSPNTDIANGMYDDYIDQFLTMLSNWIGGSSKRAYLRFAPQPNGDWFPWSPTCPSCGTSGQHINQTTASYVRMWKYIINKVRSSNYSFPSSSLQIIFDVNNVDVSSAFGAELFYPGSSYVDWFCVTGYNWGNTLPGNSWSTPTQIFSSMVSRLSTLSSTTPLSISSASTSVPNGVDAKNAWIVTLFQYAHSISAKMLLYHNADSSTDMSVFGGGKGTATWRSPLSQVTYNVYGNWSTAVNDARYGIQGVNQSDGRMLSDAQFMGDF